MYTKEDLLKIFKETMKYCTGEVYFEDVDGDAFEDMVNRLDLGELEEQDNADYEPEDSFEEEEDDN